MVLLLLGVLYNTKAQLLATSAINVTALMNPPNYVRLLADVW